jgi:hypothetical protein
VTEGVAARPTEVATTRGLLGASFELIGRSGPDMRRASFYIGTIVLGTTGPLALGAWALEVIGRSRTVDEMSDTFEGGGAVALAILAIVAGFGILAAAIESRNIAMAVLAGRLVDRPVTTRQALARSRAIFWPSVVAGLIVGVPIAIAQGVASEVFGALLGPRVDLSLVLGTVVTAFVGAPIAYVLAGVVLGDVEPFEALRRSFMVFRARRAAAVLVAGFETVTALLLTLGAVAGLDLLLRVAIALGLGPDAGPIGLSITTVLIVVGIFALGTLLYTVYALTVAPQVVMFVGLTHATFGLDRVRAGGLDDAATRLGTRPTRWLTIPMAIGFGLGGLGLVLLLFVYRG